MSDAALLIERAATAGVELCLDGDRLRCLAPAGRIAPDLQALLSANKEALRAELTRRAAATLRGPLSPLQESLYFEFLRAPKDSAYNIGLWVDLDGELDVAALEAALQALLQRHAALRTCFPDDGELEQEVLPASAFRFVGGGREIDEARAEAELDTLLCQPLAIDSEVPLRAHLLRLAPRRHLLLICIHHIAADASSLALLYAELGQLYGGAVDTSLGAPGLSYLAYARRQQHWLAGSAGRAQLERAVQAVGAPPPPLALGLPVAGAQRCLESLPFVPDAALCVRIDARARALRASRFELMLAAFARALGRCTGSSTVIVGITVSTRDSADVAATVGYFVNLVPLRLVLTEEGSADWMKQVSMQARSAQDLARIPYARLCQQLAEHWPQQASQPLVQVNFTFVAQQFAVAPWPGLRMGQPRGRTVAPKFALNVQLQDERGALAATLQSDAAQVSPEFVAALAHAWLADIERLITED